MKIGVIGTGAVGGFYGGMLAKAGNDVHFLLNSDYEYVRENGLTIDSNIFGKIALSKVNAYSDPKDMPVCDVVMVCLKTLQNKKLLPSLLPPLLKKETIVVMVQNGFGVEAELAALMPGVSIAGALAFIASNKTGKGYIRHIGQGHIDIGSYNVENLPLLAAFVDILNSAGVKTRYFDDLMLIRWKKLVWNIAFNGTTVVMNATTDRLLKCPQTRQLVKDLMLEVIRAANACGKQLNERLAEDQILLTDTFPPYKPSMMLDYENRRPMEIEYIYDNPVKEAAKYGFEMKKTQVIAAQLHFLQSMNDKGKSSDLSPSEN